MRNLLQIKNIYNLAVQFDYLVGLSTAYCLGAEKWLLFAILLAVSLVLGCTTVYLYTKMVKSLVKEANDEQKHSGSH
jgi:ABC-type bacteriocin/lantibiotic exporter with double-glycine peptidase domain